MLLLLLLPDTVKEPKKHNLEFVKYTDLRFDDTRASRARAQSIYINSYIVRLWNVKLFALPFFPFSLSLCLTWSLRFNLLIFTKHPFRSLHLPLEKNTYNWNFFPQYHFDSNRWIRSRFYLSFSFYVAIFISADTIAMAKEGLFCGKQILYYCQSNRQHLIILISRNRRNRIADQFNAWGKTPQSQRSIYM